jgi:hypothetical protein
MLWSTTVVTPKIKQLRNMLVFQWVTSGKPRDGAPGGIRTPDQVVRSHLLYPAELRVRLSSAQV